VVATSPVGVRRRRLVRRVARCHSSSGRPGPASQPTTPRPASASAPGDEASTTGSRVQRHVVHQSPVWSSAGSSGAVLLLLRGRPLLSTGPHGVGGKTARVSWSWWACRGQAAVRTTVLRFTFTKPRGGTDPLRSGRCSKSTRLCGVSWEPTGRPFLGEAVATVGSRCTGCRFACRSGRRRQVVGPRFPGRDSAF